MFVIRVMSPGEYFCCAPMFSGRKYYVSAEALEDAEVVTVAYDGFMEMLTNEVSETGLKIISSLCGKISFLSKQI